MAESRLDVQRLEGVLLIWLDSNINKKSSDYRKTITELERVVNNVKTFVDGGECIQFIEDRPNEKIFILISGSLGQRLVPQFHDTIQIKCIFIFCGDKQRHEQWAKKWTKVKGIFTDISLIGEALRQASEEYKQNEVSISSGERVPAKTSNRLDPSYMYTQLLKEVFLSIDFEQENLQEFVNHCRETYAGNVAQLCVLDEFKTKYRHHTPVWWYTRECFVYPMVNRSLRIMDVDNLIEMGFYICDLHRQLVQLHSEQFKQHDYNNPFVVYRGQGMPKVESQKILASKGGLISFNNFLSTSKDRISSLQFAQDAATNVELVGVLFVMNIDPSRSTTPFASIGDLSYFQDSDDEVLFSMHSIFRINDIKTIDGDSRLVEVNLTMMSDDDHDLKALTDLVRKKLSQHSNGWYRLCQLLLEMGKSSRARQIYERLLDKTPDERERGNLYRHIGSIKADEGDYEGAIIDIEKALVRLTKTLLSNHPHLAFSYNKIGIAYEKIQQHSKALESHENALQIYQKIRPPDHPDVAFSYDYMGLVYNGMKEYKKALSLHERALEIRQKTLQIDDPDLARSFNNIGVVYNNMEDYDKALSFHEKALHIRQATLLDSHPDLASTYNNIGLIYRKLGDFSKAVSFHERALEIGQRSLPPDHPDLKLYKKNLDSLLNHQ